MKKSFHAAAIAWRERNGHAVAAAPITIAEAPPPGALAPSGIEARVCADITRRQSFGINKYGTTVADNPLALREWLQHAYEETLDKAVYLRRAIHELDQSPDNAFALPFNHSTPSEI